MEQIEENARITLIGEDGKPTEFTHILTFMYENERYMALTPDELTEDADEDAEVEIVFMHIEKVDGEDALKPVENEVLGDELFEVMMELLDEEDGEDEDE